MEVPTTRGPRKAKRETNLKIAILAIYFRWGTHVSHAAISHAASAAVGFQDPRRPEVRCYFKPSKELGCLGKSVEIVSERSSTLLYFNFQRIIIVVASLRAMEIEALEIKVAERWFS